MAETEQTTAATPAIAYEYIWFGGQPVAQFDNATNTTHWTFTDHLGTPMLQTNAAGSVGWRLEYEPYGTITALTSGATPHQPLRFPGQEYDEAEADRSYNIFRWYRAGWGRYTQADPLAFRGDPLSLRLVNLKDIPIPILLYPYTEANPATQTDALGLTIKRCFRAFRSTKAQGMSAIGIVIGWDALQPPIPGVTKCLMHEFLYDTETGNSQGYDPSENVRETPKGAICYDIPGKLGKCVWDNFQKLAGRPDAYDLTKHNCQITINQTVTYCKCRGVK